MPIGINDPGVFVCKIDDGAPRGNVIPLQRRTRKAANAGVASEQKRAPARVWLVLALCPRCVARTGYYCPDHAAGNWWLTNWGRP